MELDKYEQIRLHLTCALLQGGAARDSIPAQVEELMPTILTPWFNSTEEAEAYLRGKAPPGGTTPRGSDRQD